MWRKLGAWFWLATQNLDDLPKRAEPMLNMIEWWICLSMPPDEVEKIARFRELNASQKALMLSAQGGRQVQRGRHPVQVDGSAVPRRAAQPLPGDGDDRAEEKAERFQLMQQHGISGWMPPSAWPRRSTVRGASNPWCWDAGLTGATRCACLPSPAVIPGSVC